MGGSKLRGVKLVQHLGKRAPNVESMGNMGGTKLRGVKLVQLLGKRAPNVESMGNMRGSKLRRSQLSPTSWQESTKCGVN